MCGCVCGSEDACRRPEASDPPDIGVIGGFEQTDLGAGKRAPKHIINRTFAFTMLEITHRSSRTLSKHYN